MLDFYAIGFAAYPTTMAEYYASQRQQQVKIEQTDMSDEGVEIIDLDGGEFDDLFNDG